MSFRRSLFWKHLVVLICVVGAAVLAAALAQVLLTVRAQRDSADALLVAQSRLAGIRVESFLASIVEPMTWVLDHDQPGMDPDVQRLRADSLRLLRKVPSVTALSYVDGDNCLLLEVSRIGVDRAGGCGVPPPSQDEQRLVDIARSGREAYGPVLFRDGSLPTMAIAVAARGRRAGVLIAEVDLRRIHATITAIRIGKSGHAYIVDSTRQLVAHPDSSLVLRHLILHDVPPAGEPSAARHTSLREGIDGVLVLSTAVDVAGPDWQVVLQLPAREAFQPVLDLLWLTLSSIVIALLCATIASYWLARRMTRPILAVRAGAARMAAGDLDIRIAVTTGDEVELLASEFNRMAAALRDSYAQLEERVRQRTRALQTAGQQVRQQAGKLAEVNAELSCRLGELALRKEDAERANAAKTRFLAAASHDLLQPMHAVGLLVGILRQRIHYPEVSALVRKVEAAVKGMETLFGSLLDVSKLDSQIVKVDLQWVELDSLLRFVELHFHPVAAEKHLVLRVARCRQTVQTDPALLERIVANLVSNAIRYTDEGKVLVGCRRIDGALHLQVHDTGIGIPPEFQDQIFEEFYQVERDRCPRGKGLGLGLSIVRRSAALLGLPVYLQARPGGGSIFGVVIPLHRHAGPCPLMPTALPCAHARLTGAFVVIVEDDLDARDAMDQLLRAAGAHVLAAASSAAMRELLTGHLRSPDLIVTDLRLGATDSGLHAIDGIRADCETMVPALILSGDSQPPAPSDLPEQCRLLRKPVGPERLFGACDQMLNASEPA